MLKVLYVSSEAEPFIKQDKIISEAAGCLPKALKKEEIDIRVVIPKYRNISSFYRKNVRQISSGEVNVAWRKKYMGIQQYDYQGISYYFIDNREYFYRDECYGYNDDVERFTFFCRAVLEMLLKIDFWPDVIHLNDWQSALVSIYLKLEYSKNKDERYRKIKTVFTIHDLKNQGRFWKGYLSDILGLDWKYFNNGDLEFYNDINLMKGALLYADKVVNLSHTKFGKGIEGILQKRAVDLSDVVEGIDYTVYNPEADKYIQHNFDKSEVLSKRADNKEYLQKNFKLKLDRNIPLIGIVASLDKENGMELVSKVMDKLLEYEEVQFICIGTGDKRYENWLKQLVWCYPKKAAIYVTDDEKKIELIHQLYASADIMLIPAQYKSYGKQQFIALRYGAVPVVFCDSKIVDNFDKYTQTGNGFKFFYYNAQDLLFTLKRALSILSELSIHHSIVSNGMEKDYSWQNTAKQYTAIYKILKNK